VSLQSKAIFVIIDVAATATVYRGGMELSLARASRVPILGVPLTTPTDKSPIPDTVFFTFPTGYLN
jgi:hypothetical protein